MSGANCTTVATAFAVEYGVHLMRKIGRGDAGAVVARRRLFARIRPAGVATRAQLVAYGERVRQRCADWWQRHGGATDFAAPANVHYGEPDVHEFFERTVGHAGQHARQLQWGVERMGLAVRGAMTAADLAGLPLPDGVL